ncbi:uncharacterized protein C8A04DRAFT_36236 [Dichotomopilus funicola]|uniref:gamma-glutamylcyclotransferase n=1 Tax=Dichotomopilus funicola TaxID=1934379 RepID=A0AAN6V4X6_9PEZI|nr:hypothetical protein C8A04DRAFT_36236 [Dichotomopilus funicola]
MGSSKTPCQPAAQQEAQIPKSKDDTALWSLRHIQILWSWAARPDPKKKKSYPPVSSIPQTSFARLSEPDVAPSPFPSEPVLANTFHHDVAVNPKTVLYLAYGSNMCAQTFLGVRGIRPLSQVNVAAPSLDLTFDLPGIPYREPCFANTAIRKVPGEPPKYPPGTTAPSDEEKVHESERSQVTRRPAWDRGLYGVVYEVTTEDYARIVATEGGGASYHDILVPCFMLSQDARLSEQPAVPGSPNPFLAHTLYAPRLPNGPGSGDQKAGNDGGGNEDNHKLRLPSWLARLLSPCRRPQPDYAQPSARYLKLLADGAREHELPQEYQAYLAALQPYTATTDRQRWGQLIFLGFWFPVILPVMIASRLFADKRGRSPPLIVKATTIMFNLVWISYDSVAKRIFGDGERTMEQEGGSDETAIVSKTKARARRGSLAGLRGMEEVADEEKKVSMNGHR